MKYIISGGGTGGHIFPALSIANTLREIDSKAEFLFVGAEGRMEMQRIPDAGYSIVGLPVRGLYRKKILRNFGVIKDLLLSLKQAKQVLQKFNPDIAIGVGGYASAPTLRVAAKLGIPTLLQEQNSYAGVTNKLLAKKAQKICVAYDNMERFFPKEKIVLTGNPIRESLLNTPAKSAEAYAYFELDSRKKTLLVVGGSLGARTINKSVEKALQAIVDADIQLIWQTGKNYSPQEKAKKYISQSVVIKEFISRMDCAYSVADLVISRAGATSISELCLLKKPVILVPSPNVSEDHQTQNALALVRKEAAILVKDSEAEHRLLFEALSLLRSDERLTKLSKNILTLAQPKAAERIAKEIMEIIKK